MQSTGARPKQKNGSTALNSPNKNSQTQQEESPGFRITKKYIQEGTRVMVLMRGVPGSGKTHLAKKLVKESLGKEANPNKYVFSTDDYFQQRGRFIPSELGEAHEWNQDRVDLAAEKHSSPIIVDNTNLQVKEMKPYAEIAVEFGYALLLLQPTTWWRYNAEELEDRNQHGISYEQICRMLDRFKDKDLTGTALLNKLNLAYKRNQIPPKPAKNAPVQQSKPKERNQQQSSGPHNMPSQKKHSEIRNQHGAHRGKSSQRSTSLPPQHLSQLAHGNQGRKRGRDYSNSHDRGRGRGGSSRGGGLSNHASDLYDIQIDIVQQLIASLSSPSQSITK